MSKSKIIRHYTDAILIMIQIEWMTATGVHETVKSTPSSMDDKSANVL